MVAYETSLGFDLVLSFSRCESMLAFEHFDRSPQGCEVIFQRGGYDVETLYWSGSIAEVQKLAREIAFRGGADAFRIIEFVGDRPRVALRGGI